MQPDGHPGFRFRPGKFAWLTVWGSPFKITGHPFSLSSSAAVTDGRIEMTIRNLGDFTSEIHRCPRGNESISMDHTALSPSVIRQTCTC
jgi:predicted ferric reductase